MNSDATRHFGAGSRIADLVADEERALRVAKALIDSGAYHVDPRMDVRSYYRWKSGILAPCYCNCRELLSGAGHRRLVGTELAGAIRERFSTVDAVVGVATAGIAWAAAVADQLECGFAYVLGERKNHGVGGLVQGRLPKGGSVVLIDDLVASGGSLVSAVEAIETESDCRVVGVQLIVNWGLSKMRHQIGDRLCNALTSYPHILTAAMLRGTIAPDDMRKFLRFYENPETGFEHA